MVPLPREPPVDLSVPADTAMGPLRPSPAPLTDSVPGPVLVNPCVPANGTASVAVMAALLTAMVGAVVFSASAR